jgi:GNAT superfamily N-acetyltransferase
MSLPPDLAEVLRLELLAFSGWPALETLDLAGWRLRFADGYTKRANSINALGPDAEADPKTMDDLERQYRDRGLRPVWRLTPLMPAAARAVLERRGYPLIEESLLQRCRLSGRFRGDPVVHIRPEPTERWLSAFIGHSPVAEQHVPTMLNMLTRIRQPVGFAMVEDAGEPLALAIGAIEHAHMGLFDVLVMPAARRRGLARRVTESLYAWAMNNSARFAYLQVVSTNAPARSLYAAQGFETVYTYHYRAPPA